MLIQAVIALKNCMKKLLECLKIKKLKQLIESNKIKKNRKHKTILYRE